MQLNFLYKSSDHLRYENGTMVSGPHGGARRAIRIEPNINGCKGYNINNGDGYIITIYNLDGKHPLWQENIQMSPKPMRIVEQTPEKIVLRGFKSQVLSPMGWVDFNGSDYGLTIYLESGKIDKCKLHMHDRNVEILYLKEEIINYLNEPLIAQLSREANEYYKHNQDSKGRPLLVQIYDNVINNPGQLKDITDFSSLGMSFYMMLNQHLSYNEDTLQIISSLCYLFTSKAIQNNNTNINLYKSRLLLLETGRKSFVYTVKDALNFRDSLTSLGRSDFQAQDAINKMEIADLEMNPILYIQIPYFKQKKDGFDAMIRRKHFMRENTLEEIIKSGIEIHCKLIDYLDNKVMREEDLDF